MARIEAVDFNLNFPIFNASSRSLTSKLLNVATGGRLDADSQGRLEVTALDSISFKLNDGDRVALLGHNGSGKSTLLRAIAGIYPGTSGEMNVQGRLGSLIDLSLGINPEATGKENIFIRGALLGIPKRDIQAQFDEIVAFSELGNFIELPVRTYSTGMHLRLAFAVSTVVRPEILLMDEWLSVGDEGFKAKAERRLEEIVGSTKVLVVATHSRDLVEKSCNRAIWLEHGRIVDDGPAAKVAAAYWA
jgi:lipopolysaccharide transport system ATP-binding protein